MNYSRERRRALWLAVLVLPLLVGALGYVLTAAPSERYVATSTVLIRLNDPSERMASVGIDSSEPPTNQAAHVAVQVEVILSAPVLRDAAQRASVPAAELSDAIRADQIAETSLVEISARHEDPDKAKALSSAVVDAYIDHDTESIRQSITRALTQIETRRIALRDEIRALPNPGILPIEEQVERNALEAQYTQLANRAAELEIDLTLKRGSTEVLAAPELDTEEVGTTPVRNLVSGLVLGGVLSVALALVLQRLTAGAATASPASDASGDDALVIDLVSAAPAAAGEGTEVVEDDDATALDDDEADGTHRVDDADADAVDDELDAGHRPAGRTAGVNGARPKRFVPAKDDGHNGAAPSAAARADERATGGHHTAPSRRSNPPRGGSNR